MNGSDALTEVGNKIIEQKDWLWKVKKDRQIQLDMVFLEKLILKEHGA